MTELGAYTTGVYIDTIDGNIISRDVHVVVYDKNEQDQMLKDVWNSMNNALLAGDVDKAAEHLS